MYIHIPLGSLQGYIMIRLIVRLMSPQSYKSERNFLSFVLLFILNVLHFYTTPQTPTA